MQYILPYLIFIIPAIGMLAGLVSSFTIIFFFLAVLIFHKNEIRFYPKKFWLEILFISWGVLSAFWSIDYFFSIKLSLGVFSIVLIYLVITNSVNFLSRDDILQNKVKIFLILGVLAAIILFFIEKISHGTFTKNFRLIFQNNSSGYFALHMLDRGCALLCLISWIAIGILTSSENYLNIFPISRFRVLNFIMHLYSNIHILLGKNIFFFLSNFKIREVRSISLYIAVLITLICSDSLAGFLGFLFGGFVVIFGRLFSTKFYKILRTAILIGVLATPFIAYNIEPRELSDKYSNIITDSAKHRLFIWNFVAHKAFEKPLFGFGVGAAGVISKYQINLVDYKHYRWSLLPLHPHNNILQIFLEMGVVGLVLFLLLINKYLTNIEAAISDNNEYWHHIEYACFINYFIIGMISYSIWQIWWVCSGLFAAFMMRHLGRSLTNPQVLNQSS